MITHRREFDFCGIFKEADVDKDTFLYKDPLVLIVLSNQRFQFHTLDTTDVTSYHQKRGFFATLNHLLTQVQL